MQGITFNIRQFRFLAELIQEHASTLEQEMTRLDAKWQETAHLPKHKRQKVKLQEQRVQEEAAYKAFLEPLVTARKKQKKQEAKEQAAAEALANEG